jgi:outer membrane receptor protein involved in Fe transport
LFREIKNEIIEAFEVGYSFNTRKISVNVNGYLTYWQNRPLDVASKVTIDEVPYSYNINGIDAFHKGIEIEFGWKPIPSLQWDQVAAIADWRWTSGDSVYIYDDNNKLLDTRYFDARGVHVGDAAQIQLMESLRWEIIKYLYVSGSFTLFAKNYSQFDPISLGPDELDPSYQYLDADGKPRDSWMLPIYYLVDLNAGYRFTFKKFKLDVRASVLNLLDRSYISDAQNNDSYSTTSTDFNAASAGVFFGNGRTFNVSLALSY